MLTRSKLHPRRYGYASIWEMQEVVDNYTAAAIPLDVMWGDIDYMDRWRDFTFDPVNFPLPAMQVCTIFAVHCLHCAAKTLQRSI